MAKIIDFPITVALEECKVEVKRSQAFYEMTRNISEFIHNLPLNAADNDHMVALLVEQLQEAEKTAFLQGFDMGVGIDTDSTELDT